MKKLITLILLTLSISAKSQVYNPDTEACPVFTPEQQRILRIAYKTGGQYNQELYNAVGTHIGHSLAAIVWKESFVGEYIIRFNTGDGQLGSYGVGHVQLTTLFWMDGVGNTLKNRDELAPQYITRLLIDDYYAIHTAYRYLKHLTIREGNFYNARMRYNGRGAKAVEYADDVTAKVLTLIRCGI
jgi:hypothetical protein